MFLRFFVNFTVGLSGGEIFEIEVIRWVYNLSIVLTCLDILTGYLVLTFKINFF